MDKRAIIIVFTAILLALTVDTILGCAQSTIREAVATRKPAIQSYGGAKEAIAPPAKPAATAVLTATTTGESRGVTPYQEIGFGRVGKELISLAIDLGLALIIAVASLAALRLKR